MREVQSEEIMRWRSVFSVGCTCAVVSLSEIQVVFALHGSDIIEQTVRE